MGQRGPLVRLEDSGLIPIRYDSLVAVAVETACDSDPSEYLVTGHDLLDDTGSLPGWPLARPPMSLETSRPGVFAAGDVRHRSIKRVASAVGAGSMAIQLVHDYLAEESPPA